MDATKARDASDKLILPRQAGDMCGVTAKTLRRWHAAGLISARRTLGGQRRYWESEIRALTVQLDEAAA